MKIANQIPLLRYGWIVVSVSLCFAGYTAQGALVQINTNFVGYLGRINTFVDLTLDGTLDNVFFYNVFGGTAVMQFNNYNNPNDSNYYSEMGYAGFSDQYWREEVSHVDFANSGGENSTQQVYFTDARINQGQQTYAMAEVVFKNNFSQTGLAMNSTLTLTRVVFNNTSSSDLSGFNSATTYNEWSPSSTPVPEPGAFLPAVLLVAAAFLRRRRPRSHRSGSARP